MTTPTPKLTLKAAKATVRALGLSLIRTTAGDYRLMRKGETNPDMGYYTDSLLDAVSTAPHYARNVRS